jgi:phage terminase large subunit-like protein
VAFFENLRHTKGQFAGHPFRLLPWELQIVRDVYGTLKENGTRQYKYVYLEIPKKNGKSQLAAGAALYHTFADGEMSGEIYGCAAEKKQAGIVFKAAKEMIEVVPALAKRARITDSTKTITDKVTGSIYQVISAEAYSKHGFNISACIFDELHAQPSRDLWDVMTFEAGSARAQPIWWIITTAGDDPDRVSIGWEEHEYAMKILGGDIIDPTWYVAIYNYDGDDIYNEENWYKANPSLGVAKSLDSMREAAETAKNKPANERLFRWLDLNQWITTRLTSWQPVDLFDSTVGNWNRLEMRGMDCYLGLDLSSTTDLTSLCLIFPPQKEMLGWRVIWENFIPRMNMQERIAMDKVHYDEWEAGGWLNVTEGNVVDYTKVEEMIHSLAAFYNIKEVDNDPAFATMLTQRLAKDGMTTVDIPQTYVQMTDPINLIEVLLKEGKLTHEASPVARWAFGNASIATNGSGLIKLVKEHKGKSVIRTKRIDPMVAWVCGMARARFYSGSVDISAAILDEDWGV